MRETQACAVRNRHTVDLSLDLTSLDNILKDLNEVMPDSVVECDLKKSILTSSVSLPPRLNSDLSKRCTRRKKLITNKGPEIVKNFELKGHFTSQGFESKSELNTEGRPKIIYPPILSRSLMNLEDPRLRAMDLIRERKI